MSSDSLKHKPSYKRILKNSIALIIVAAFIWFFTRQFSKNISDIQALEIRFNWYYFAIAVCFIILAYMINTLCWKQLINSFHSGKTISYKESIGIVNTTQLAKYLPGKLWSFAAQMMWLSRKGFSTSKVLFVNIVATISSLMTLFFIGTAMWSFSNPKISLGFAFLITSGVLVLYIIFIMFHTPLLNLLIRIINKLLKKNISIISISLRRLFITQLLYLACNFTFSTGCFFICMGIGIEDSFTIMIFLVSSMLIGDIIGFVALISPGGLGVREWIMFWMISGTINRELAIIYPVVSRLVVMTADISSGLAGLLFLKIRRREQTSATSESF